MLDASSLGYPTQHDTNNCGPYMCYYIKKIFEICNKHTLKELSNDDVRSALSITGAENFNPNLFRLDLLKMFLEADDTWKNFLPDGNEGTSGKDERISTSEPTRRSSRLKKNHRL